MFSISIDKHEVSFDKIDDIFSKVYSLGVGIYLEWIEGCDPRLLIDCRPTRGINPELQL